MKRKESFVSGLVWRVRNHPNLTAFFVILSAGEFSMVLQFNSVILTQQAPGLAGALTGMGILMALILIFGMIIPFYFWWIVCPALEFQDGSTDSQHPHDLD